MRILLPLDLIQPIEPTIALLEAYVPLKEADLRLLYVRELLPAYENVVRVSGNFSDDWEGQITNKAKVALENALATVKTKCRTATAEVTSGPQAMMISAVAKDEQQDLIVLTPGDHSPAERLFSGSVSNRVAQHAAVSVLIARPKHSQELKHVVIGVDGSKYANEAIESAIKMFKLVESKPKVTLVHAVDIADPIKYFSPVEFVSAIEQNMLMAGEAMLADAEKLLADVGIKNVDCLLIEGDPAKELITIANEDKIDLLVIGAHGHSAVQHLFLGGVSHKVAAHAHCSVAVMKHKPVA